MTEPLSEFPVWPSSGTSDPRLNKFLEWVRKYIESIDTTLAVHTLAAGHGDVVISTPVAGDYLRFDGADWIDVTISTIVADLEDQIPLNYITNPTANWSINMANYGAA